MRRVEILLLTLLVPVVSARGETTTVKQAVAAVMNETAPRAAAKLGRALHKKLGRSSRRPIARALNGRGYDLFKANKLSHALLLLEAAAAVDPSYGMPRYSAARIYALKNNAEGCLKYLGQLQRMRGQLKRLRHARKDRQFKRMWNHPGFKALFVPAVQVVVGDEHTCVLMKDGSVLCWGDNEHGQLGSNVPGARTPQPVEGVTGAVALAAGHSHNCVLLKNGAVKCWGGFKHKGKRFTWKPVSIPGLPGTVKAITAGSSHSCALTRQGAAYCWGNNYSGQVGNNSKKKYTATARPVVGLQQRVTAIVAGHNHTCAVVGPEGALKCWGLNDSGQVGNGSTKNASAPVDVVGLSRGVRAPHLGYFYSCAIMKTGGAKCWGSYTFGKLGVGNSKSRVTAPMDVVDLKGEVVALAGMLHSNCALLKLGGMQCWGYPLLSMPYTEGGYNFIDRAIDVRRVTRGLVAVVGGYSHMCGLTRSGGVKCWGYTRHGLFADRKGSKLPRFVLGLKR